MAVEMLKETNTVAVPTEYIDLANSQDMFVARIIVPDGAEVQAPVGRAVMNLGRLTPDVDSSTVIIYNPAKCRPVTERKNARNQRDGYVEGDTVVKRQAL